MHLILQWIAELVFLSLGAYTIITVARLRARSRGPGVDTVAIEERLARLEGTLEGLSVESQRLAEGHRFMTELMSKRVTDGVTR